MSVSWWYWGEIPTWDLAETPETDLVFQTFARRMSIANKWLISPHSRKMFIFSDFEVPNWDFDQCLVSIAVGWFLRDVAQTIHHIRQLIQMPCPVGHVNTTPPYQKLRSSSKCHIARKMGVVRRFQSFMVSRTRSSGLTSIQLDKLMMLMARWKLKLKFV